MQTDQEIAPPQRLGGDRVTASRSGRSGERTRNYAEALIAVAVALLLSWTLQDYLAGSRMLFLWLMSVVVAWRGGLGPVAVASVTGVLLWDLLVVPPVGLVGPITPWKVLATVTYLIVSLAMGLITHALRRTRRELSAALDGMTEGLAVYDDQWRLLYANGAVRTLARSLGVELDRAIGRVIWEELPQLVGTPFETEVKRAVREGTTVEFDGVFEEVNVVHVRCVPTADGGVATFVHDLTPAQRAEAERRRLADRYQALVDATTTMVWRTDGEGRAVDLPAWTEATGQTTAEMRGTGWLEVVHPDDRERALSAWETARREETPYEAEFRVRLRDGSYRWFHSRGVPLRERGRVVEWIGVLDDVHEARVARERRAAVDNALAVLGASLDYQWTLAALTRLVIPVLADYATVDLIDEDGICRRVSTAHVDAEGEELLRRLHERYPGTAEDASGVPAVIRRGEPLLTARVDAAARVAGARSAEHRTLLERLGTDSSIALPLRARGVTFGALSLAYAGSGRHYTPADLAAAQEIAGRAASAIDNARLYRAAAAASRAKSEFLATMSHELRTPLNAISGYADLLLMGVRGALTEEQRRDVERIQQNQQHLLEIITDILDFSRLDAGRLRFDIAPVPVGEVLARMEGVIEPQARARALAYECALPESPLVALADRDKLEQVLINLLGNAVKFTPRGGRIRLEALAADGHCQIRVRDSGIGIPSEQLAAIFEPFVQLDSTLTRTSEGTGLGLAISRALARGMGGELVAESVVGEGSTFTVTLPSG